MKDGQRDPGVLPPPLNPASAPTLALQGSLTQTDPSDQDQEPEDSHALGSSELVLVSERQAVGREKGTWHNVSPETIAGGPKEK